MFQVIFSELPYEANFIELLSLRCPQVITIYYLFLGYYKGELKILRKNLFSRGVSKLFCQFFTPSFSEG